MLNYHIDQAIRGKLPSLVLSIEASGVHENTGWHSMTPSHRLEWTEVADFMLALVEDKISSAHNRARTNTHVIGNGFRASGILVAVLAI